MNKRYWFVVVDYNTLTQTGKMNMGFVSDDENTFSNETVKKHFIENNKEMDINQLVVVNFFEFKNQDDYSNFWTK